MSSLSRFALRVLEDGHLAAKLAPPRAADGALLDDDARLPARFVDAPARAPGLAMTSGADRLPKRSALEDPALRAATLARFAHHELMAVELFAWALLAYPDAPSALRRGLAQALEEEQRHLALYLARLDAYGTSLEDHPRSGYFWKVVPTDAARARDVRTFLAAVGLTLEAANLDFTRVYEGVFRQHGDDESADIIRQVHDDEIGHVRLAHTWMKKLDDGAADDDVARYEGFVPFPLSASRAKGRPLDVEARRRAGFSEALIAHVRDARPAYAPAPARR